LAHIGVRALLEERAGVGRRVITPQSPAHIGCACLAPMFRERGHQLCELELERLVDVRKPTPPSAMNARLSGMIR
jgi:hypothetical protein